MAGCAARVIRSAIYSLPGGRGPQEVQLDPAGETVCIDQIMVSPDFKQIGDYALERVVRRRRHDAGLAGLIRCLAITLCAEGSDALNIRLEAGPIDRGPGASQHAVSVLVGRVQVPSCLRRVTGISSRSGPSSNE